MCTVWLSKELKVLKLEATVLIMKVERQKNEMGKAKKNPMGQTGMKAISMNL